jgi:hypothetical protein
MAEPSSLIWPLWALPIFVNEEGEFVTAIDGAPLPIKETATRPESKSEWH